MNATAQLSGFSRPFSLRFICCVCAIYLFLSDPKLLPLFSSFEVLTDASVFRSLSSCIFSGAALDANLRGECAMNGAFTPVKSEIGKRLLALVVVGLYVTGCGAGRQKQGRETAVKHRRFWRYCALPARAGWNSRPSALRGYPENRKMRVSFEPCRESGSSQSLRWPLHFNAASTLQRKGCHTQTASN